MWSCRRRRNETESDLGGRRKNETGSDDDDIGTNAAALLVESHTHELTPRLDALILRKYHTYTQQKKAK